MELARSEQSMDQCDVQNVELVKSADGVALALWGRNTSGDNALSLRARRHNVLCWGISCWTSSYAEGESFGVHSQQIEILRWHPARVCGNLLLLCAYSVEETFVRFTGELNFVQRKYA